MSSPTKHQIEFSGEKQVDVHDGQSILHASLQAGIPHFHACGGKGKCSTCRIMVLEGMNELSAINVKEQALRQKLFMPANVRLACQTYVLGDTAKVKRLIRDKTDVYLYVQKAEKDKIHKIGSEEDLVLFFLDIRHFTPFMEKLLAFDVIHVTRRLFLLFENAINAHHGKIIETAGDGLYAIFGFDTPLIDAAANAYNAGMHILCELEKFNQEYLKPYFYHALQVGIGIHAGRVITGIIDINGKGQLTVMGLPVIIASRLQATTRELDNNFITSDFCYSLIANRPEARKVSVRLKGLTGEQEVYLLGSSFQNNTASSS